jgi:hypothetical protein
MLPHPLAVMVISSSAAGKSSLMDSVLQFVPDEHCVKYSAMTGQALYYMAQDELRQKVLAVVEEQGAERTAYALKLLQSEGELTIASTGKDPVTGRLETKPYHVEGPVALFVTTTSPNPDEELANRCVLMTVNESREQTRAIHEMQRRRRTEDGLFASQGRGEIVKLHQNAQRLLKPLAVVNNLARALTFLDDKTRTRRDHEKYLNLIEAIAFLRQYQRPHRTLERQGTTLECVDVLQEDVELANQLASQVMGRTLDELFPQDRKLLQLLGQMVRDICARDGVQATDVRLSRRQIREWIGWTDFQVRVHLQRLVELEYVLMLRGGGHSYVYELLYDGGGDDGRKFLMGVSEPLRRVSEGLLRQSEPHVSPICAPVEPHVRVGNNAETPRLNGEKHANGNGTPKIPLLGGLTEALTSYAKAGGERPE